MQPKESTDSMDTAQIVAAIKQRRDLFWDRQILGKASDSAVYSEAELARAIADEYDGSAWSGHSTTSQERMNPSGRPMAGESDRIL
jgi:hypothetical protein